MADKLKHLITNLTDGATLTVGGTWAEDSAYPKTNLYNQRMSKRGGFDTAKAGNLVIDLGSAKTVKCCALMNHNLTSGATVSIQGNATDAWGAPSINESMTWRALDMFKEFTGGSYRYWRLVVDDAGRSANDIKIGELILGELTELDRNFDFDVETRQMFNNVQHMTTGRNKWTHILEDFISFRLSFSILTAAQLAEVQTIFAGAEGNAYPFLAIFETVPYYVRLNETLESTRPIDAKWLEAGDDDLTVQYEIAEIELIEETRGL